jgi:hypothetical protein
MLVVLWTLASLAQYSSPPPPPPPCIPEGGDCTNARDSCCEDPRLPWSLACQLDRAGGPMTCNRQPPSPTVAVPASALDGENGFWPEPHTKCCEVGMKCTTDADCCRTTSPLTCLEHVCTSCHMAGQSCKAASSASRARDQKADIGAQGPRAD